ncbi:reverse transcriptase [Trichonephila clavipes]|nr:reverse transcriptase [Trichonephila clavipes]
MEDLQPFSIAWVKSEGGQKSGHDLDKPLNYGCEVVTLASTTNLEKYDVIQNNAVRIITGGAKLTPVTAMQLQTGIEPLDSHRDKFTLKIWGRARKVDCRYWNEYRYSQAAILALSSKTTTDCINIIQCRTKIAELISYGRTTALLWAPSHVEIPDNERANQKAKQGAESNQLEVSLTLRRAKSIISTYIDKYIAMTQKTKSFGKHGKLATVGSIPRYLERAETVARFRLTTGHDFLGVYLH